jgi:hypothetical protein
MYFADKHPQIETFLERVDGPTKQPLLVELIELEIHIRRLLGETIPIAEYQARFPGLSAARLEATLRTSSPDPLLNNHQALKMILSGEFASKEAVDRFYSEAKAAALLDYPGIVPIFEVGAYQGKHFFSMDAWPILAQIKTLRRAEVREPVVSEWRLRCMRRSSLQLFNQYPSQFLRPMQLW